MSVRAALLLLSSLLALGRPVLASDHSETYRVRAGDTLELLAAEYYGDRKHKTLIMVENGLSKERSLRPGEHLNIPISAQVVTAPGDSLQELAEIHLGDKRRADFLADFNELSATASIGAGLVLRVPLRIHYLADKRRTLGDVAKLVFGDSAQSKMLKKYNFRKTELLNRGDTITIPVFGVEVQSARIPALSEQAEARVAKRNEMIKIAQVVLRNAQTAWREGDFAAVRDELNKLDGDYLNAEAAVEVEVLLGSSHVAFGDEESARETFARALRRNRKHVLPEYDYSPKIRRVWDQVKADL